MPAMITRRTLLAGLTCSLANAATRLPANKNVRWALGSNLWNSFPPVPFTEILDVMRDTGFIGIRLTQFPGILTKYDITAAQLEKEVSKRNLQIVTISFNGHDLKVALGNFFFELGRCDVVFRQYSRKLRQANTNEAGVAHDVQYFGERDRGE